MHLVAASLLCSRQRYGALRNATDTMQMDAEIIAIGSELLLGTTVDTNSAYLAQQLSAHGINVFRKSVVGDNTRRIAVAMNEALHRADLVICTGGLGPTVDDVTREAVAEVFGRPLEFRQELLDQVAARFASFGRPMSESNRRQAYLPRGARAIENPRGTAPAFLVQEERGTLIGLPGVPHEMRFLMETAVLPYLRDERGIRDVIVVRTLHATGAGESVLGEQIADLMESSNPTVGISAKRARYELRIGARATSHAEAEALIAPVEAEIQRRLGSWLLGSERLEQQVSRLLREQQLTLALYEGHTSAPVYHSLADDDASLAFLRGVVIHPLDEASDEAAAASLARAGATYVRDRWHSHLGLGLEDVSTPDPSGATTVCVVLAAPDTEQQATYRYDLNQREGWGVIGTLALNMLRDYLLARQP